MDDIVLVSLIWMVVGSMAVYYTDRKAYDSGFLDAVQLHSEGRLTYTREIIGDDEDVLTIEVVDE